MSSATGPSLTVVIPSFNSAAWLPSTLDALRLAIRRSGAEVEVIVVDDGSTDGTPFVLAPIAEGFGGPFEVVIQENRGRFFARWEGIQRGGADNILLLDSRVLIEPEALRYVMQALADHPEPSTWNGFVVTDPAAPLIGLFWEVPTHVFWGRFLRRPRVFDLTSETFDAAPKGTTMFLAPRTVLQDAFEYAWPSGDARLMSDDTRLLRRIVANRPIRLDPGFAAIYRPRVTVAGFTRHSFDRGTLFVDSYAGTSTLRSAIIIGLAVLPPVAVVALVALAVAGFWWLTLAVLGVLVLSVAAPVLVAARNRCPARGVLAFLVYLPVFAGPFWAGLVRGVFVHRGAFRRRSAHSADKEQA